MVLDRIELDEKNMPAAEAGCCTGRMKICFSIFVSAILLCCGCRSYPTPPEVTAGRAENIVVDGILNEKCWSRTPEYSLTTARTRFRELHPDLRAVYGRKPAGPGKIRFTFDGDYLYVGAILKDDDIMSLSSQDQQLHSGEGDVLEIFLKPEDADHYWEIHISPAGYCAVLFYPSRGYHFLPKIVLPQIRPMKKIKYKSIVTGTLNRQNDYDRQWTVEAAIPLNELARQGVPLDTRHQWRILIGRYNYSCHQKICELSSLPQLERFNFHAHEEYAFLKLDEKPQPEEVRK